MKQSESIQALAMALCEAKSTGWWQIPGFSKYLIGDAGEVYTLRGKGRVLTPSRAGAGYRKVTLIGDDGVYHHRYVHHLVASSFNRERLQCEQTRHLDGNPENNSICNLAHGTPAENAADKERHGTESKGEKNGMAKLTAARVEEIRCLLGTRPQSHIAKSFGVSPMTISRIANNKLWRFV